MSTTARRVAIASGVGGPAPATTVTGPDAYGASAVVGTGTTYARDDHNHGLPAAPSPSLTTTSSFITATVVLASGVATNITSISVSAGTWLIVFQALLYANSAGGPVDVWIGPTTASVSNAYSVASATCGNVSGAMNVVTLSGSAIVTVASTTTVFLEVYPNTGLTANNGGIEAVPGNVATGLTAVKIG